MAYKNYNVLDLGNAILNENINADDVTFTLRDIANLPTTNFILSIKKIVSGVVTQSERIYVATRTGDVLSGVVRGYAGTTAQSFNDGDEIQLNIVAEHIIDLQTEVARLESDKANDNGVVHNTLNETVAGIKTFSSELKADTNLQVGAAIGERIYGWSGSTEMWELKRTELTELGDIELKGYAGIGLTVNTKGTEINALFADDAGNVGIGTTSPTSKLQVNGSDVVLKLNSSLDYGIVDLEETVNNRKIRLGIETSGGIIGTIGLDPLQIKTGNTTRVTVDTSGNVGIGTTTPGSKLSVVGLPTSATGLSSGDIWNNAGVLSIV